MAEIEGLASLKARLATMRTATENLQPALLRAGVVVLKAAQDRIDAGGPGWAPNASGTPLLHQTGRLLSSLTLGGSGNIAQVDATSIVVGTNVRYARWLQEGTGIYGPSGQPITPKSGRVLAFSVGGRTVFARSVKGTSAHKFLYIDQQASGRIAAIFAKHIMGESAA